MDISVNEIIGNEIVLEVTAENPDTTYEQVQVETDKFIAAEYGDNFEYTGAGRVGLGITSNGIGVGHQARFFVGYKIS